MARSANQTGLLAQHPAVPQLLVTMLIIEDEAHIRAVVRDAAADLATRIAPSTTTP